MKKIGYILILIIISLSVLLLGFNNNENQHPHELYQVYLDGEVIGVVKNKKSLEKYIDKRGNYIKKKYKVDKVYGPTTLEIKKILTYNSKVNSEEEIYKKISEIKPFTVKGYQFSIKNEEEKHKKIYVLDHKVFEESIENTIKTFTGSQSYGLYKTDNQPKIETVGSILENVYLEDNITVKEMRIPVNEKIYLDSNELSRFLLFGTTNEQRKYTVVVGDTIETVAFNNKISSEEFLISNPSFTSKNNLLFPGQEVVIGVTDPQVKVVVVEHLVRDTVSKAKPEIRYDAEKTIGTEEVIQEEEEGLDRITQKIKKVNGTIVFVKPVSTEELKPAVPKIILKGEKKPTNIGDRRSWTWPTGKGWVISSNYEYRIHPFTNKRELHAALDIAIGYGAHIYTANNGTVIFTGYNSSYGNHIIVNHRNGYYTLYAHLSRIIVKRGQDVASGTLIGYMGSTGISTGPHLHFEVWRGEPFAGGYRINPWGVLR